MIGNESFLIVFFLVLVSSTQKPIEYIDEDPFMSLLQKMKEESRQNAQFLESSKKSVSESSFRRLGLAATRKSHSKDDLSRSILKVNNTHCINLKDLKYSKVFSKFFTLKKVSEDQYMVLSGLLSDLLHYCILCCWNTKDCSWFGFIFSI